MGMDVERRDVCEVAAPTLLRVLARPVLLARDRPDEESRPVAPIPEGTIVEVLGRTRSGWFLLRSTSRGSSSKSGKAWIPEKNEEQHVTVSPVLPALFEVGASNLTVRCAPSAEAEASCVLESRQIFDVICHDNEWLKVYYGETAEIGKWWTRPFGWIHAQTDSDDSVEFIHLRGLVPTTEGRGGGFQTASYFGTPRAIYAKSKDLRIQYTLDLVEKAGRPIDNASSAARRKLEDTRAGSGHETNKLNELLKEEALCLPLLSIKSSASNNETGLQHVEEVVSDYRFKSREQTELKVTVECSWYAHAHAAPITCLKFDRKHGILLSGCEKPGPSSSTDEVIVKGWNPEGAEMKLFEGSQMMTVRSIEFLPKSNQIVCSTGEGLVLGFDFDSAKEELKVDTDRGRKAKDDSERGAALFPRATESDEPTFIAETGFRGRREGYVFRKGEWGIGYYRTDVIFDVVTFPMSENVDFQNKDFVEKTRQEREKQREVLRNSIEARKNRKASVFSKDTRKVYYGSPRGGEDFRIVCHRLDSGEEERCFRGHSAEVLCLALDAKEEFMYSGSYDKSIIAWSLTGEGDHRLPAKTLSGHTAGVHGICLSDNILYSCSSDNTIRAWNVKDGNCVKSFFGQHAPSTWPVAIAISPDQRYLVSGSKGPFGATNIKLWSAYSEANPHSGSCVCTFTQLDYSEPGTISSVAFGEDSKIIFTGASDGTIAAWKISETRQKKTTKTMRSGFFK